MTILAKPIKPSRFKVAAIWAALINEAQNTADDVLKDFQATTATWDRKPEFVKQVSAGPNSIDTLVATDDEIYRYVDEGTKPHPIFAGIYTGKSNKKALAFPGVFSPKTTPGVIGSGAGYSGGDTVLTPYVQHPGTEARGFSKTIQKKWEKPYKRRMEKALKVGVKASGHAYA